MIVPDLRPLARSATLAASFVVLSACGSDDDGDQGDEGSGVADGNGGLFPRTPTGVDPSEFSGVVRDNAGPDAEACGEVGPDEIRMEVNACLVRAFNNGTGAYAVFRLPGTPSERLQATIVRSGIVLDYALEPSGEITAADCPGPRPAVSLDTDAAFDCVGEADVIEPPGSPLADSVWIWESYRTGADGELRTLPPADPPDYVLVLAGEGVASVETHCSAPATDGAWSVGAGGDASALLISGLMPSDGDACDEDPPATAIVPAETYWQLLESASSYSVRGERLTIATTDGGALNFTAAP